MTDIAIKVENVSKLYRIGVKKTGSFRSDINASILRLLKKDKPNPQSELLALNNISFELKQGEALGIIGLNGGGKSTLLKIISRITQPTKGRIDIYGRVASLLEVGTGFHAELTGRENIFLNGTILGMSRHEIKTKFDEIVQFSGVERFIDTPVKHYSSGMYVRLAFAVAAHLEPEILIIDEVLAVGDAEFQKKCIGKMQDVAGQGRTILFVSHNMSAVQSLCTKAITLRKGELIGNGPVKEQIELYYASMENKNRVETSVIKLNEDIEIHGFYFSPNPIETGSTLKFSINLFSRSDLSISGFCLLIYTIDEIRLSIIDLRKSKGTYFLTKDNALKFEGQIEELGLVEGVYYIGLYIESDKLTKVFYRLFELEVFGTSMNKGVIPYETRARGYFEFPYQFEVEERKLD